MNEERIDDFIKKYRDNGFANRFSGLLNYVSNETILNIIDLAINKKDRDLLSVGLDVGFHFNIFNEISRLSNEKDIEDFCKSIGALIDQSWHNEHENIVEILHEMHSMAAVGPLKNAVFARPPYLIEPDNADSLSRRAIWALGKLVLPIGRNLTKPSVANLALQVLTDFARSQNIIISSRAKEQLRRFQSAGLNN